MGCLRAPDYVAGRFDGMFEETLWDTRAGLMGCLRDGVQRRGQV
jgi:hypothetical protein